MNNEQWQEVERLYHFPGVALHAGQPLLEKAAIDDGGPPGGGAHGGVHLLERGGALQRGGAHR